MFFKMAWRNIWRNKRRTTITLIIMILSFVFMLVSVCIGIGYHNGIINNSVKAGTGHIQIHKDKFHAVFTSTYCFKPTKKILDSVKQSQEIRHHALRIKGSGLVSYTAKARNVTIMGIQPDKEPNISLFHQKKKKNLLRQMM